MVRGGGNGFGGGLVHREGGGAHAGMRVGDAEPVEHALDGPVLAETAMQRVEHRVGRGVEPYDDEDR